MMPESRQELLRTVQVIDQFTYGEIGWVLYDAEFQRSNDGERLAGRHQRCRNRFVAIKQYKDATVRYLLRLPHQKCDPMKCLETGQRCTVTASRFPLSPSMVH